MENQRIETYKEFWPFYLKEHSKKSTRIIHFIGTTLAFIFIIAFFVTSFYSYLLAAIVSGYAFAWGAHFFVEHNKPATFQYPYWSLISDWKMWFLMLIRKL